MVFQCLSKALFRHLHSPSKQPEDLHSDAWSRWDGFWSPWPHSFVPFCGREDTVSLLLRVSRGNVFGVGWNIAWARGKFSVKGEFQKGVFLRLTFTTVIDEVTVEEKVRAKFLLDESGAYVCGIVGDAGDVADETENQHQPLRAHCSRPQRLYVVRRQSDGSEYGDPNLMSSMWRNSGLLDELVYFQVFDSTSGACDNDDDDSLCIICCEALVNTILLPCGHASTCYECASKISECAICRCRISHSFLREDGAGHVDGITLPLWEILQIRHRHSSNVFARIVNM